MVLLSLLQMLCQSIRHLLSRRIPSLMYVARPCCIGIKDGKIHTLSPSFSNDEIEDAQIIDAE
jgi:hypothetical protein